MNIANLFTLTNLIILAAVALAVFGAASFLAPQDNLRRLRPEAQTPGRAAASAAASAAAPTSLRPGGSAWQRLITRPFKKEAVKPSSASGRNPIEVWLIQAGYDSPLAAQTYFAVRIGLGLVLPVFALLATPIIFGNVGSIGMIFAGCLGVLIGVLAPVKWVNSKLKSRQRQITDGMPEVLDLMLVCTEAGLGTDTAIDRVGEECAKSQPVLAAELRVISLQLRAGRPRADALHAFAERTGVEEVRSLVNLLVQADAFGTSIAQTLRVFSEDMRTRRLLRAEEAANTVTVKLSIVLVACFLPALLTAIMAPIVFHAIAVFPHFGMTPVGGSVAEILWLSGYGGLLATAVLTDLRALRIPNLIPLLLVGLFVIVAVLSVLSSRPVDWPSHLLAGAIVFAAGLGLFAWGKIGGGDVKLLTAVALWHGMRLLPGLLLWTALLGGVLGLAFLALRKSGLATLLAASGVRSVVLEDGAGIPYAVAIVAACGLMLPYLPFLSN